MIRSINAYEINKNRYNCQIYLIVKNHKKSWELEKMITVSRFIKNNYN